MSKRLIQLGNNGTVIIGTTQHGKTTGAVESLKAVKQGVLFFNTQQIRFGAGWVKSDMQDDTDDLISALRSGHKINYEPSRDYRQRELATLIDELFKAANKSVLDIYIVVDEVHLYDKDALKACREIATTGLRWGIKPVWISQRPQAIDNYLMSQSTYWVMYKTYNEPESYFRQYGIPYTDINSRIPDKYYYCTYNGATIDGPYRVK